MLYRMTYTWRRVGGFCSCLRTPPKVRYPAPSLTKGNIQIGWREKFSSGKYTSNSCKVNGKEWTPTQSDSGDGQRTTQCVAHLSRVLTLALLEHNLLAIFGIPWIVE